MSGVKRVILIIIDSLGVGALPDAEAYGDAGSNTLRSCFQTGVLNIPTMKRLGLFNIDGIDFAAPHLSPIGAYGRMAEASSGKDTTIGHWEIAGIISSEALPTYPGGFPADLISRFEAETGYLAICNKPYSGTEVLKDFGAEHLETPKSVIVYTSADSVFQVAAHTDVVPLEELYRICGIARELLIGKHGVGRVIARPFDGPPEAFSRRPERRDFSITPPRATLLDIMQQRSLATIGVGKIEDIFAGSGVSKNYPTKSNTDGMKKIDALLQEDFTGLCFANLVEFDMVYGHRNDAIGYANALNEFDAWLDGFLQRLRDDDLLIITADHGCDPGFPGTDHTREYVPLLIFGKQTRQGVNLNTRSSFADVGKTIAGLFELDAPIDGVSVVSEIF